jgi:hypothetical protein
MIVSWVVAAAALVVAALAWARAQRTARRLDQLVQMYWGLKYQHGELLKQLQQTTEPHEPVRQAEPRAVRGAEGADAFVPLKSLRR